MKARWWMSWIVSDEDYRPLTYPPNAAILGWWITGYDADDNVTLCGLIQAETVSAAKVAVLQDWPGIAWRFVELRAPDYEILSDRFPLADWMKERMTPK